jgi:hypothetical protein
LSWSIDCPDLLGSQPALLLQCSRAAAFRPLQLARGLSHGDSVRFNVQVLDFIGDFPLRVQTGRLLKNRTWKRLF